jgi:hypothetical protein
MEYLSKNIYLAENECISADREGWENKKFQHEECQYKGRCYQIHQVMERPLKRTERIKEGLKALIVVIATLGIVLLFSSTVRELCSRVIYGSKAEIYWKPVVKTVPKPIRLNLEWGSLENGFSLEENNSETKDILLTLVETWNKRDPLKENWSVSEFADFLVQDKASLQKLFDLVNFIPDFQGNYSTFGIGKLLKALKSGLFGEQTLRCRPSVKSLWGGHMPIAAMIFGKGNSKESWKIDELSRFLAVSQNVLIGFLGEKKDQYSYDEINLALKRAPNCEINGVLEKNRTQTKSIRWAMID